MGILCGLAASTAPKAARATDGPAALVAATRILNPKPRVTDDACDFGRFLLTSHEATCLVLPCALTVPKSRASCVFRVAFRLLVSHKAVEVDFAFCIDAFDVRSQFIFQREDIHWMTRQNLLAVIDLQRAYRPVLRR